MISLGYRVRHGDKIEEKTLDIDDKLQRTKLKLRQVDNILTRHGFSLIEHGDLSPESMLYLIYQNKSGQRVCVNQKWYGPHCDKSIRLFLQGHLGDLYTNEVYVSTPSNPS